jgi:tetratricopeptide (TPR) repeat protein
LEGGVQRVGNQVRINVQLINGQTDEHLWAEIYDRELTTGNLFAIQSDITKAITRSLQATLTSREEQVLEQIPTENLAAYDAYISGRTKLNSLAKADTSDAVTQFTQAIQLDPNFAAAWAGLCQAQLTLYGQNSDQQHFDAGEAACNQALKLGDPSIDVHIALGKLYRLSGRYSQAEVSIQGARLAKAEQALETALSINSRSLDALIEFGFILAVQNRLEEAETQLLRAIELNPNYWSAQSALFDFYYNDSDKPDHYELAAQHAVLAASLRPDMAASWNNVGTAKYMLMQYDQATEAWQRSLSIEPTRTAYTNSGLALESLHRYKEAAAMQEKAAELAPRDHRSWGRLALALTRVEGENERAMQAFERATKLAREKLEVNGQDWRTLAQLASYLAELGEIEEAKTVGQSALKLSGRRSEALLYAATVYCRDAYTDTCFSLLEEMVEKDSSYRQFIDTTDPKLKDLNQEQSKRFQAIIATP